MKYTEENFSYHYNGTNCYVIDCEKGKGDLITITNDYGEIMYKGYYQFVDKFLDDLKSGVFA